jgi:chromosomal replication initiator protein
MMEAQGRLERLHVLALAGPFPEFEPGVRVKRMSEAYDVIWKEIANGIRKRVSADTFRRWFSGTRLLAANEESLRVQVPNHIYQVWIETNYMATVNQSVLEVLMAPRDIEFVIERASSAKESVAARTAAVNGASRVVLKAAGENGDPPKGEPSGRAPEEEECAPSEPAGLNGFELDEVASPNRVKAKKGALPPDVELRIKRANLNPRYRFDSFVVGATNEFARAACLSVASKPAQTYNPLFIHGAPGLGKTHLLHAIGREVLISNPKAKVVLVTSEDFTNDFVSAIQDGSIVKFRNRYRKADVLLMDDIHFLGGKERTQEEFFHTFNALSDGRRQIVLTSDRPAAEISNLEERIITRCEWGLSADLQPPDIETRTAILRKKMQEWKVSLPDHVVEFLADRIRKSVRRLEGGLMRLASYTSLSGKNLSDEKIEGLLKDILREEGRRRVTVSRIQKEVAEHFDIRLQDMTSKRRPANIAFPRQVAMYLSRTMTDLSLVEIGQAFGGRDHGTVIHATRTVEKKMDLSKEVRQAVAVLSNRLSNV